MKNNDEFMVALHDIINAPNIICRKNIYDPEIFHKYNCMKSIKKAFKCHGLVLFVKI